MGLTLFFLVTALRNNWQDVAAVRFSRSGWRLLAIAFGCTTVAHVWSAMIWARILRIFQVQLPFWEAVGIYLRTNLAKYLPGNIWHFYGRMTRVKESGSSWGVASLSVLLEPLLLAAGATIITVVGLGLQLATITAQPWLKVLVVLGLLAVFVGIHPRFFNPVIQKVSQGKTTDHLPVQLTVYPWQLLLSEVLGMLLRGICFLSIWQAIAPLDFAQIPQLLGIYTTAWLTGFIVPGAPGGIGVFETVALILLETVGQTGVKEGNLLLIVAIFRLVTILGEVLPLTYFGWRSPSLDQTP